MRGTLLLAGLIISTSVSAQQAEVPTRGLLYNTTENHSIVYDCTLADSRTIDCNFTQTAVRRKLSSRDAAAKLEKARSDFSKNPEPMSAEDCKTSSEMLERLTGKRPVPDANKFAVASPRLKADMVKMVTGIAAFCQSPTLDNFTKVTKMSIDKDAQSCLIASNHFTQRLRRSDANTWTVIPERQGPCGIVQLDRFEADSTPVGLTFWNYIARKAVTNPNASFGSVPQSCKGLDQAEYKYEWRTRELDIKCDYVEFSPL